MAQENKVTDYFKLTIQNYLESRAQTDELFAPRYANPKKNIDDCVSYILSTVYEMFKGENFAGMTDPEVYSLALHYYDEDDIKVGKCPFTKVVVNHTIELTEAEKAEARQKAMQQAQDEAYKKLTQGRNKPKQTDAANQQSLF